MDHANAITVEQLRQYVERLMSIEEEKRNLMEMRKDVLKEAKYNGFDTKALNKLISLLKKDENERREEEAVLELYREALNI